MRRAVAIALVSIPTLGAAGVAYTQAAARLLPGTPPAEQPKSARADFVLVEKSSRRMTLLREGCTLAHYEISLGADGDDGHKRFEGDERTPQGIYTIDWRNPHSVAHLSLRISYPDAEDIAYAKDQGRDPGGNIMIHGWPNGWGFLAGLHRYIDWTNGCIAVTNAEMQQIWSLVPDGTPIEIRT